MVDCFSGKIQDLGHSQTKLVQVGSKGFKSIKYVRKKSEKLRFLPP